MSTEDLIRNFVKDTCRDRESSHGYEHMSTVCDNALLIHAGLSEPGVDREDVMVVALLHDVADHKYDQDGQLRVKLDDFLTHHYPDVHGLILKTIDAISYSKEHRLGQRWFEKQLGAYWTRVRDIVSDADKLEALGVVGVERCMNYASEIGARNQLDVMKHLVRHMNEKLLGLKDYIITDIGKSLAVERHDAMVRKTMETVYEFFDGLPLNEDTPIT
jgi:uncharacterized protein